MLEWPRHSVYDSRKYLKLRKKIINPGPGTPKAWAYPWCVLNGRIEIHQICMDFGCGSWTNFTHYISGMTDFLTVGLDLANLQKNTDKVRFLITPTDAIQFPDGFFDRVFSISVLEHVPVAQREAVFKELFRVLRPGGLAVLVIDWVFGMNSDLLQQLSTSQYLGKIGSQIYGNYDFAKLLDDYSDVVTPLESIDRGLLPGAAEFDENRILADTDILVSRSTKVTDVELFRYTALGLILKKL